MSNRFVDWFGLGSCSICLYTPEGCVDEQKDDAAESHEEEYDDDGELVESFFLLPLFI